MHFLRVIFLILPVNINLKWKKWDFRTKFISFYYCACFCLTISFKKNHVVCMYVLQCIVKLISRKRTENTTVKTKNDQKDKQQWLSTLHNIRNTISMLIYCHENSYYRKKIIIFLTNKVIIIESQDRWTRTPSKSRVLHICTSMGNSNDAT